MTPLNMLLLLPAFLGITSLVTQAVDPAQGTSIHSVGNVTARAGSTCADPSLARTVFEGFDASIVAHTLRFHGGLVNAATTQSTGAASAWVFQGPSFQAWPSQQPFTVPLWQLITSDNSQIIFMAGADAQTPPVVSGFSASNVNIWVYNTAVCGSVPLMSAVFPSKTDHYYTTDPDEHAELLQQNWNDGGVVGFVLPLPSL